MNENNNKPTKEFILFKFKERINDNPSPINAHYNSLLQIWIKNDTKEILIDTFSKYNASPYGETTHTATSEGMDRPEIIESSNFGETTFTETREGTDQSEIINSSNFGETILTKTSEGTDQVEISNFSHTHHSKDI